MCIVGSYVSFGRSPYRRAFIEECTGDTPVHSSINSINACMYVCVFVYVCL